MIFPNLNLWTSAGAKTAVDSIDRSLQNRQHRLVAGISVDRDFEYVDGCLAVIRGQGKFAALQYATGTRHGLPQSIRIACRDATENSNTETAELVLLLRDLAEVQALVVEDLKLHAGKYVDRILAVAAVDPGIWLSDFDGRPSCQSMCDAATIAEISGINVIDAFPQRDLSVGGNGRPLAALPAWILFADRNPRVANIDCIFVDGTPPVHQIFTLPASDGLDAELPAIGWTESPPGANFKDTVQRIVQTHPNDRIVIQPPKTERQAEHVLPANPQPGKGDRRAIQSFEQLIGTDINLQALTAALLGMFYIDQMPANVPALTGAESQRILGRLTPGRPSNWRQLIRAMAQHQPAPMKLKDAI